ncbi:MAG: PHP domain-containing protein [Chloroflexi bacterium]|nr:PHP domain-containing protein [Chloroflexota bacterium]MCL5273896.1 PHP domain-containing protein [Chloroflexota bacterium]
MITELHCHTRASDGTLTPAALVQLAALRNINVLAITDHDTLAGHAEAIEAGRPCGIRIIRGIEVSSLASQGEVHVLGYGVEPSDEKTAARILELREARDGRAKAMVAKLHRLGIPVSYDRIKEIAGDAMVGRPHVARALLEGNWVSTRQEAFDVYLAEGMPAFVPHQGLTPAQAVGLIHRANGIAIVAHPGLYVGNTDALLDSLLEHGLDGIEVYYPLHTAEQIKHYAGYAFQHNLLATGGSDFHGFVGDSEVVLGSIHLPEGTIEALDLRIERLRAASPPR